MQDRSKTCCTWEDKEARCLDDIRSNDFIKNQLKNFKKRQRGGVKRPLASSSQTMAQTVFSKGSWTTENITWKI